MKKLYLLLGVMMYLYAYTPNCDVFSIVLQTRNPDSKVIPKRGTTSILHDSRCRLNTTDVKNDTSSDTRLLCDGGEMAIATGNIGSKLDISYSFSIDNANTVNSRPWQGNYNEEVTSNNQNLPKENYDTITQDYNNYSFSLTYNGDKKINNFNQILNNVSIKNIANHNLYIGYFSTKPYGNTQLSLDKPATNIEIYQIQSNGSNDFNISLEATNYIKIHNLKLNSSADDTVILKAPKIVIDNLHGTNDNTNIKIYANQIDIGNISLAQHNNIEIHSYDNDHNVTFHSNSITASSSSTMILDSGDYYTNSLSIPGTRESSSIVASDNSQIINFYINGDFTPGNNPGINSGSHGNFNKLSPLNFRMFINGDLKTGGGGTTFNALVYVEGNADLGSPSYVRGALSSGGDILIGNDSEFYYDLSIFNSDFGVCIPFNFENSYSCNIFPSVLTAYDKLKLEKDDIFATCNLSTNNYIDSGATCSDCGTCNIIDTPKNKYTHTILKSKISSNQTISGDITITNRENGNYTFNSKNQDINLKPNSTYNDNPTKLMLFKDVIFDKSNQTLTLEEGDYYFKSFISNQNHFTICPKGDVRIFVKNNFELNGNNINIYKHTDDCNGELFVYTENDAVIGNNDGGNNNIHLFLYAKDNVTINNNANSSDIYGAITAQNDINVTGNNINFHYDTDGLDKFGLGKCSMCYNENYIKQAGFSIFRSNMCTPVTPCEFDMPIKNTSNTPLDDVKIIETYKSTSSIDISSFSNEDTIDQDGNHVGNGASKDSSTDYSLFNIVDLDLDNSAIIYDFGDNYPTYEPNKTYYRAYKKSIASISVSIPGSWEDLFKEWKNNVVYLAQYTENGRTYAVNIEACPITHNTTNIIGFLDAWDDYNSARGINDRNISTKIVNKNFNLNISYIPGINKATTSKANVKYYLIDVNNQNNIISAENFININSNTFTTKKQSYTIDKAYQNVKVEFKACAYYKPASGYTLYPYGNCSDDCSSSTEENNICFRYFQSTDAFAIRPNNFSIAIPNVSRADNNITASIKALDYTNNPTQKYNMSSDVIDIEANEMNPICNIENLNYRFNFENGIANIEYLKYPEVGDINLTISEKNGYEFAKIDEDDTKDEDRLIKSDSTNYFRVLPDHFTISSINVNNFNNSSFTYLSNDLNMSATLSAIIEAKNASNNTTQNYTANCYSRKIDINITHTSTTTMDNLNNILTQYSTNDKNLPISFRLDENNFTNGQAILNLKINFDRNSSKIVNPFILTLNDINLTDENETNGSNTISQNINFIYGRVFAQDVSTIQNSANLNILFQRFNGIDWIKNTLHNNKIYGDINETFSLDNITISLNETNINGEQNITVTPNKNTRPYKVKLHLNIPTWLWYSSYGMEYEAPSNTNTDCLTHPCVNILFEGNGNKNWNGIGTNEKENNVTKNTINSNIKQNTRKNNNFHRLSW